ncbi:hypothetical protein [Candidatus Halocynthiibacter alkanivorans]|uniref:hypothetical protein n=1 Tax=Candidatus Halocynthiibacter alkanivorans TaxID=2267619 RepID=UPI000DF31ED5|nr:hypothetical protein [Candidatus Halocynthiibacter alkanivorans]
MFMIFQKDREGLVLVAFLHAAWLLAFPAMVLIPLPYFPVLFVGILVFLTAYISHRICRIKDRLRFLNDNIEAMVFPPSKPFFLYLLKLEFLLWSAASIGVVLAIIRMREFGVPEKGMGDVFIPYLLAQGFSINLIHHFVRNRFFPSEWEARSG